MFEQRRTSTRIRTAAVAILLAAGLLVTGCTNPPMPPMPSIPPSQSQPADPQSQSQQCQQLMTDVQGIATGLGRVGQMLGTDPIGAFALVGEVSSRVGDLQTRVTDPALLQRIEEIQASWNAVVADAEASLTSGDPGGIERATTGLTQLGEQVSALQEFCTGNA